MSLPPEVDPRQPVIVGVGQHLDRDGGQDPVDLMAEAIAVAGRDAGSPGLAAAADVIGVVPVVSWRYFDPGRLVADRIGADPSERWYPAMGGNTPQQLLNKAALAIADGSCDVAIVCGGESYRTRQALRRNGNQRPDWAQQTEADEPTWGDAQRLDMGHPAEVALGILMPTQCYPLFETALRHRAGHDAERHQRFLGELWAGFAAVAADNPYAWDRSAPSADDIATVTAENRMIGYPYTKRMVSNPDVDMSSAVILCSAAEADARGIDRDRWVFPWSGTDGADPYLSARPSLVGSAAMRVAGGAALELAEVGIGDIAHLDLYSCFPSAVQLAAIELGIGLDRQLTVYGGLPFAGGPWNNPVGHAIAAMVDVLRSDAGSVGLVTANGGIVQKHAFGVYSTAPPPSGGFRHAHPQFAIDAAGPTVEVAEGYEGPARIESWTVMHERDGSRSRAHATLMTPDGSRTWGVSSVDDVMAHLESADVAGSSATVGPDSELLLS